MTTFELAEILGDLAKLLRQFPESELGRTKAASGQDGSRKGKRATNNRMSVRGISIARMSKYTKAELADLIRENSIPIEIRTKDSATNVFQRLQRHLQDNRFTKKQIRNQVAHGRTSPELTSALSYLLRDTYE